MTDAEHDAHAAPVAAPATEPDGRPRTHEGTGRHRGIGSDVDGHDPIDHDRLIRMLADDGSLEPTPAAEPYADRIATLGDEELLGLHRDMVVSRRFDTEATNLQRQGQLALWPPSAGQEAAQVGSARAARAQDTIFPSYREHIAPMIRGVDPLGIIRLMRGVSNGGWDPEDPANGRVRLYTLVLGTQALHATGYAMGVALEGRVATGDSDVDEAVLVYFGDGASSQGDVSEALLFAASYAVPQVFFLQNNQWAISVPVSRQSRIPLHRRADGFGMPGLQLDGNDVLASLAVTGARLDAARAGEGPSLVEAVTYRIGAHTTSDDPTKYRSSDDLAAWVSRDPIARFRAYLERRGVGEDAFRALDEEAADLVADVRRRTLTLVDPEPESMFEHVYSEPHPVMAEQSAWLERYESSLVPDDGDDA